MQYKKEDNTKSYYENINFNFLKRSDMAAVAINGEDFVSYTENFQKPYDNIFLTAMTKTLRYLCASIPDCVFGYTKEFDLYIFFEAPKNYESPSWFDYDTNRIAALTASMATLKYNESFNKTAKSYVLSGNNFDETRKFTAMQAYVSAIDNGALFTSKCFNIKKEQIKTYISLLKQQTVENAVRSMGLMYFKETELDGKSSSEIRDMVFDKNGTNFDDYPAAFRCGSACVKNKKDDGSLIEPSKADEDWVIDPDFYIISV